MEITIPDTVKTYCACEQNTMAMDELIKCGVRDNTFDDYLQYIDAKLFAEKFKRDMWQFRYKLWKAVWGELCKEKWPYLSDGSDVVEFAEPKEYDISFYVTYKIGSTNYNFIVTNVDGSDSEGQKITIGASKEVRRKEESVIPKEEIKKYPLVKIEKYNNCDEYYTESKYSVDVTAKKESIEDQDIEKFKEAAESILRYIEADTGVKAKKPTKGKK